MARTSLTAPEPEHLDGIAKELLRNPFEFLKQSVEKTLPAAGQPGEVLARLSAELELSIHVARPQAIEVPRRSPADLTIDQAVLQQYSESVALPQRALQSPQRRVGAAFGTPQQWIVPMAALVADMQTQTPRHTRSTRPSN
jgi:hypothetical protein